AGLDRFDGYQLKPFVYDPDQPGSLPDNDILCLHVDPAGRLWAGTQSAGLVRYDAVGERFVAFPIGPGGLSGPEVTAIADDGAGGLWIGTRSGLDHLISASGQIHVDRHDPSDHSSLPSDQVTALLRDRAGVLWVGTANGLARQLPSGAYLQVGSTDATLAPALADHMTSLLQDADGRIWAGTFRNGPLTVDATTGLADAVSAPPISLHGVRVSGFVEIRPGTIWIGTDTLGIVVVDTTTHQARQIHHNPLVAASLTDDFVSSLLRDRAGLVWIGTEDGLDRVDPSTEAVATIYAGPGHPDGIPAVQVTTVAVAHDGQAWLGLSGQGLAVVDPLGRRTAWLQPDPAHPERSLPRGNIYSIAMAGDGTAWIGTDLGLYRTAADRRSATPVRLDVLGPSPTVRAVLPVGDELWLGTMDGLLRYRPASSEIRLYPADPDGTAGLTDSRCVALLAAGDGGIWVGTEHGLNRLDPASGRIERILPDPSDRNALANGTIWTLATDSTGRLWVGTDGGIDVLDPQSEPGHRRFRHIGMRDGLPNSLINALVADREGRMWASTDYGLAVIDPATFAVRPMLAAEGVRVPTYWQGSVAAAAQGELLFGGSSGLTVVRTSGIVPQGPPPSIVITEARIGESSVSVEPLNRAGDTALVLPPGERGFRMAFAGLDIPAADRLRYAYRLDGFDPDWVPAPQRVATYTNLSPGDYLLHLRVHDRQAGWSESELPVHVLPLWYQSLWFRMVAVAAIILGVAGVIQIRTAALIRRRAELQRLVDQRTAELLAANRQLEALATTDSLTGLSNRRRFLEIAGQELDRSRRLGHPLCVAMADLDHFKTVNDTSGHLAGDTVLRVVGRRFQDRCRRIDTLARYGGEEFVVLMPETDLEAAVSACERLRNSIGLVPVPFEGRPLGVTVSLGVAQWLRGAETLESLVERADKALYLAKQRGRNRVEAAETGSGAITPGAEPAR
ncbi:MAG TPA: diguanylate cyclase, partial [Stellaceae bacterium]|nr:diguanylate cyclase [Stellaceae bacterium]